MTNTTDYQPKKIPQVLHYLGMVICGAFTFMGAIYVVDVLIAGVLSMLAMGALFLLVPFLCRYKTAKGTYRDMRPEYALLGFYFIAFLFTLTFIFHFADVDLVRKDKLKEAGISKLKNVTRLSNAYGSAVEKKVNNLNARVEANTNNFFTAAYNNRLQPKDSLVQLIGELSFEEFERMPGDSANRTALRRQIKKLQHNKVTLIRNQYKAKALKADASNYEARAYPVFGQWKTFDVRYYYYTDVDRKYRELYQTATKRMPDFRHEETIPPKKINIDNPFYSLTHASGGIIALCTLGVLLLHLLVLAPYLAAERSPYLIRPKHQEQEGEIKMPQ